MPKPDLSEAIQDYLKEIYKLEASGARATTTAVARSLGVAPSSATAMVKKLAALELVDHAPYRGVELTEAGRQIALEVVRHHRLLEVYLAKTLGLGIDAVHAEADRLEHVISEELEARIDQALGFPTHDPHGDPIPDAALNLDAGSLRALGELAPGESATVRRIPDGDAALLRYLADRELVPGCEVVVQESDPPAGPVTVDVDGRRHELSGELAGRIGVG
ncbi:MAG TPA: metal-dependent transcriptional regulator [Gaiellaceae bacterium]|jgi:DtxR family Mn-dependent transcriptional regulator|nr:metal-dependent transcriptional regulator [Gaiellaceae bacterium]